MQTIGRPINRLHPSNPFSHNDYFLKLYSSVKIGDMDEFGQFDQTQYLDDVFNHKFLAPLVRYVRISTKAPKCLHMLEVEVYGYDYNTNLALNKTSKQYPGTQISNHGIDYGSYKATDGNYSTANMVHCDHPPGTGKFHISACKFLKYDVFFTLY